MSLKLDHYRWGRGLVVLISLWTVAAIKPAVVAAVEPTTTVKLDYGLVNGWTFISFPFKPITVVSAAELLMYVNQQGGLATTVCRWDMDHWQSYMVKGDVVYGESFELKPLEGFFVLSYVSSTFKVAGLTLPNTSKISLVPGWNSIGLTSNSLKNARTVLERIDQGGVERATEIDRWFSGNWTPLVLRLYSADNIQEYGDNFEVGPMAGYMIKANQLGELAW